MLVIETNGAWMLSNTNGRQIVHSDWECLFESVNLSETYPATIFLPEALLEGFQV